jgi:hypothetical protein
VSKSILSTLRDGHRKSIANKRDINPRITHLEVKTDQRRSLGVALDLQFTAGLTP